MAQSLSLERVGFGKFSFKEKETLHFLGTSFIKGPPWSEEEKNITLSSSLLGTSFVKGPPWSDLTVKKKFINWWK